MYVVVTGLILSISLNGFLFLLNQTLKAQNEALSVMLDVQNEAIRNQKLESEKYACNLESLNEFTRNKYDSITHDLETCDDKLAEFEKALGIFEQR